MRLRHIPGSEEEILKSPHVVQDAKEKRGRWSEVFGNDPVSYTHLDVYKRQVMLCSKPFYFQ